MSNIRFSIVMPVYNVKDFVTQALQCILEQTYPAYEIIMVDDCSTDTSVDQIRKVMDAHTQVKLLQQEENQGVSAARNRGLDAATGDYIFFLDPDDFVEKNLLVRVAEEIQRCEEKGMEKSSILENQESMERVNWPEVVVYSLAEDYYQTYQQLEPDYTKIHRIDTKVLDCDTPDQVHQAVKALERETMYGYPWNKAYRLDYLREQCVRFKKVTHIEDILFNLQVFMEVKHIVVLPEALYHYRNSGQARLTSKYLPEYFELQKRRIQGFIDQMRSWNTLDQEALEIMANFYFRSFISMMQRELEHQEEENRSIALYGGEGKSESAIKKEIIEKSQQEMQTDLYRLLRGHVSRKGKVAKILFTPLAEGKLEKTYQRVKVIRYVKSHWSGLFMRLKQHR